MSDRVRLFMTGSNAAISTGDGTQFPEEFPLNEGFVKWYYRVKLWRVTSTLKATYTPGPTDYPLDTQDMQRRPGGATRENELRTLGPGVFDANTQVNPVPGITYDMGAALFFGGLGLKDGKYYPAIQVTAALVFSTGVTSINLLTATNIDPGTYDGTVSYSIDGNGPYTMYWTRDTDPFAADFSLSGTLEFTPIEYWPYAAADGSPIYNTSTGSQLQSPLN